MCWIERCWSFNPGVCLWICFSAIRRLHDGFCWPLTVVWWLLLTFDRISSWKITFFSFLLFVFPDFKPRRVRLLFYLTGHDDSKFSQFFIVLAYFTSLQDVTYTSLDHCRTPSMPKQRGTKNFRTSPKSLLIRHAEMLRCAVIVTS